MTEAESFHFEELEYITVGTLGPRGERVFYLQCRGEGQFVSLKIEKQQVAALADYLERILNDLPDVDNAQVTQDLSLREPVVPEWAVGSMGVAYAEEIDKLIVVAEQLLDSDDEREPARARFALDRGQVSGLIERAQLIVSAGRPPCQFCGRPLESANGDWCPCHN